MAVENIVIVGGGLAGATAAKTLRAEGFSGPVVLVAAESHQPYLRPPLSKEYLLGKAGEDALPVVPGDWYDANNVDLRLGAPVTRLIRPPALWFGGRRRLEYGSLLLATGSAAQGLPLPGQRARGRQHVPDGGGQPPPARPPRRRRPERGAWSGPAGSGWNWPPPPAPTETPSPCWGWRTCRWAPPSARTWAASSARCTRPTECGSGFRRPRPRRSRGELGG